MLLGSNALPYHVTHALSHSHSSHLSSHRARTLRHSFAAEAPILGVLLDPVQILRDSGVNSRVVRPGTPVAPRDHSDQLVPLVGSGRNQRTAGIALARVAATDAQVARAHHVVRNHRRGVVGFAAAHVVCDDRDFNLLQRAGRFAVLLEGAPAGHGAVRADVRLGWKGGNRKKHKRGVKIVQMLNNVKRFKATVNNGTETIMCHLGGIRAGNAKRCCQMCVMWVVFKET